MGLLAIRKLISEIIVPMVAGSKLSFMPTMIDSAVMLKDVFVTYTKYSVF